MLEGLPGEDSIAELCRREGIYTARIDAKALAARAAAVSSGTEALIARLKLEIEKFGRELYCSRSERNASSGSPVRTN